MRDVYQSVRAGSCQGSPVGSLTRDLDRTWANFFVLFRKQPFKRTVDYGIARKIRNHRSREAAAGIVLPGTW